MFYFTLNESLPPELLDTLLVQGWYRMRQNIFTTNAIHLEEDNVIPVWWARISLQNFTPNSRHRKLARLCKRFNLSLHPAVVTAEIEELYALYRKSVDFDTGDTVASFLLDERGVNYFPSRMWQLQDGDKLIGIGYFDEGQHSSAGILNFYHPDYRKYSAGLWLYFETIRYAAESGKQFFYPGYVGLGYNKFDYKLLAGTERVELWDPAAMQWVPFDASEYAARVKMLKNVPGIADKSE